MTTAQIPQFCKGQQELLCGIWEALLFIHMQGHVTVAIPHHKLVSTAQEECWQIESGLEKLHESDYRIKQAFSSEIQGFQSTEFISLSMNSVSDYLHKKSDIMDDFSLKIKGARHSGEKLKTEKFS